MKWLLRLLLRREANRAIADFCDEPRSLILAQLGRKEHKTLRGYGA